MDDALRMLIVFALIAGNAFFVIGEYAVVTARRSALAARADAGSSRARVALRLMDDPVRVISTVQVGITALGILTGAIAEPLVREMLGDGLPGWATFVIAFTIVTYLSVLLGELVPKALTLTAAETLLLLVAPPITLLSSLLRPAVWVLERSAATLLKPFGIENVSVGETISSTEELRAIVDEAEGSGVIAARQETLLHNVLDFSDRDVLDILLPASEVDWLDAGASIAEGLDRLVENPHSRYLVADGSLRNLRGVVHVRELVAAYRTGSATTIGDAARPAHIVPETKLLGELLEELRAGSHQLAAVVDEYGGTVGIVTLEDILEELVGEIYDEYDTPIAPVKHEPDGSLLVAGWLPISELAELLEHELTEISNRTIGGAVFAALGRAPEPGDAVEIGPIGAVVAELDGVRITRVQVRLIDH
jgi:putative hemolysin